MNARKILIFPDPKLKQKSLEVEHKHLGEDLTALTQDLIVTMLGAKGVGIAAIQVGVPKRIIVVKREQDGLPPLVMLNPVITERSSIMVVKNEGCLSFPDIWEEVRRHIVVKATWMDVSGGTHEGTFIARDAHVIQHETEHLEGMLLSDRMTRARRGQVMGELRKKFRR